MIFNRLSILDRYLIQQFMPPFIFSVSILTILAELIGITFENINFVASNSISVKTAFYLHLLKLPAFISIALPVSMLMATLITFSRLSKKNETTAFRSTGISLPRVCMPVLMISVMFAGTLFISHELVVPPANLKAAILLEKEWNIDRSTLAKYNKKDIVYEQHALSQSELNLEFLFFAHRFKAQEMQGVTFLKYTNNTLSEIIVSRYARWDELSQVWKMRLGYQYVLDLNDSSFTRITPFQELPVRLTKSLMNFVEEYRDIQEMNVLELYHRLNVIEKTKSIGQIRKLKFSIQERYALPFSCLTLAFLGSSIGAASKKSSKVNNFALAAIVILAYYALQFLTQSLMMGGVIPVLLGAWIPNILGLLSGYWLLKRS